MFLVRRAAQALALRDRLRRDLPGRGVVAVSVGLEDRVHLLLRELREQAVHPDAGGQDAQAQFPLPDQLRGPSFVEIAEQVPGLRLVEPDHAEVPPAVLVHRRRRIHEVELLPHVPRAVEGVARALLEHEDPGLRPFHPLVDDPPRLRDVPFDALEDARVERGDLEELPVEDAPHRDREARVPPGHPDERVLVLGPEADLPEGHRGCKGGRGLYG